MVYRVAIRHLMLILVLAFLLDALEARAELVSKNLNESVVAVNVFRNKDKTIATGVVVQADPYNGYVVANSALVKNSDTLSVTMPETGAELVAQIVKTDATLDLVLLKINGLNLPPLTFSLEPSSPGDVVWSAGRGDSVAQTIGLSTGNLQRLYRLKDGDATQVISHTAAVSGGDVGSVLLNECGELIGFNRSGGNYGAIDGAGIVRFLSAQNVRVIRANAACISAVWQARKTAEQASEAAAQARLEATEAQRVAEAMAVKLLASDRQNQQLVKAAGQAKTTAEMAIKAAADAQAHAEQTRINLEQQTASIMAETEAMVQLLQSDRDAAEARFNVVLEQQRRSSVDREDYLIAVFVVLLTLLILAVLLIQRGGFRPAAILEAVSSAGKPGKEGPGQTVMHTPALQEYVLDGRDEDGIRYLLRISGDQLSGEQGIVIGRNPNESPYTINHVDVSRQHARLKVMKNRVFIEDLGSTNGTSVNGQNIDDKGLVSVSNGDQIIIGSVVMKLRVMGN